MLRIRLTERSSLAVSALLAVAWAGFHALVTTRTALPPLHDRPTIILSADPSSANDFGAAVRQGIEDAQHLTRVTIEVVELSAASSTTRRRKLFATLATRHVVAVISADTSRSLESHLPLYSALGIPTLVTVATKDDLLEQAHGSALRLLPQDSKQAATIATWMDSFLCPALLHDDTPYATALASTVVARRTGEGRTTFLTPIATTAELSPTLAALRSTHRDALVFVGYYSRLPELLGKLEAAGMAHVPVLLSDGCYFSRLNSPPYTSRPFRLTLSFPTSAFPTDDPSTRSDHGYARFGHDAYLLILGGLRVLAESPRASLPDAIRAWLALAPDTGPVSQSALKGPYNFAPNGENDLAAFYRVDLAPAPAPQHAPQETP